MRNRPGPLKGIALSVSSQPPRTAYCAQTCCQSSYVGGSPATSLMCERTSTSTVPRSKAASGVVRRAERTRRTRERIGLESHVSQKSEIRGCRPLVVLCAGGFSRKRQNLRRDLHRHG